MAENKEENKQTTCEDLLSSYRLQIEELIIKLDGLRRIMTHQNVDLYITVNTARSYYSTLHDSLLDLVEMLDYLSEYTEKVSKKLNKLGSELLQFSNTTKELRRRITNCLRLK